MGKFSNPVQEMIDRLTAHTAAGKMLAGYNFDPVVKKDIEGIKDLPFVRILEVRVDERSDSGLNDHPLTVMFSVATRRSLGFATHMQAVELVWDALETNAAGAQDVTLEGTLVAPIAFSTSDFVPSDISDIAICKAGMSPLQSKKGSRHL